MNKTFDINRFWQVLKWTIISEKKSILTAAVAFTVAFLAIELFSCFTIFDLTRSLGHMATEAGMVTCVILLSFLEYYYASGILGNAHTAQQRVTALMLPASNLEKFLARFVYCCIFMLILLYVAAIAATGLRMLLELIAGHDDIVSGFSVLFDMSSLRVNSNVTVSSFFFITSSLWSTSLFVLGGVFFSKRPFIWTNVTMIVGSIVLFTLLFYIGVLIGEENLKAILEPIFRNMSMETFEIIVNLMFTAFTVFNVWLSYRLYTRLQVVQHKWFNL